MDRSEDLKLYKKALLLLEAYFTQDYSEDSLVCDLQTSKALLKKMDLSISQDSLALNESLEVLQKGLEIGINVRHPHFLNQLYSSCSLPGVVGEFFSIACNTSCATFEVSPFLTAVETELKRYLIKKIGFENGEATFVSGGTQGNFLAMLCARNILFPSTKRSGVQNEDQVAFCSDQGHYSFCLGANQLGLGEDNLIKVTSKDDGSMHLPSLIEAIENSIEQKKRPFLILATAGTTVLGAFDPIEELAKIAKAYGMWLHVDGAFGGSLVLSSEKEHFFKGIEQANSFSWDMHKMLNVPLYCSALFLKDKGCLKQACSLKQGKEYLFHEQTDEWEDLGQYTMQCARRADAFKFWFALKYYGEKGMQNQVDDYLKLARIGAKKLKEYEDLQLFSEPFSVNLIFRYFRPELDLQELNMINAAVRKDLLKKGRFMINFTTLKGVLVLRLHLINPNFKKESFDELFKMVKALGDQNFDHLQASKNVQVGI